MNTEEAIICLQGLLDNPLINKGSYLAQAIEMAIQALEKENIYDDGEHYVTISKALYDKLNIDYEALSQEPCDNAVSREAVCNIVNDIRDCISVEGYWAFLERLKKLPSVTQKSGKYRKEAKRWKNKWLKSQKSGHWIHFAQSDDCSECGWSTGKYISPSKYCPNCGAKMIEPQESEE